MAEGDRASEVAGALKTTAVNVALNGLPIAVAFLLPPRLKARLGDTLATILSSILIVLACAIAFAVQLLVNRYSKRAREQEVRERALALSGLQRVFPQVVQAEAESEVARLVGSSQLVRLLLCSGFHHIGNPSGEGQKGFLANAIDARPKESGPLEILLLDPDATCVAERAAASGIPADLYREGIRAVIWALRHSALAGQRRIEVRLLDAVPDAQLLITKNEVWVWSTTKPTERSLLHCCSRLNEDGLGAIFASQWASAWQRAKPLNLATAREPEWRKVKNRVQSETHAPTPLQLPAASAGPAPTELQKPDAIRVTAEPVKQKKRTSRKP